MTVMQQAGEEGLPGGGGSDGLPGQQQGPGQGTPWYAGLAENGAELPEFVTNAPDFETFVKTAEELKNYQGSSLRIPGPDASEEDVKAFHAKLTERVPGLYYMPNKDDPDAVKSLRRSLGVPENGAEGYQFQAPEGGAVDENMTAQFRNWANELDLSQEQAAGLYQRWNEYQGAVVGGIKEQQQTGLAQLKAEWGVTYDDRVKKIDHLLSKYSGTENMRATLRAGDAPPHVIKMFHEMAESVLGEGMNMVGIEEPPPGVPPAEAAERAREIRESKAFNNPDDPGHRDAVQKHLHYMKMANPQSEQTAPQHAGLG